MNKHFLPLIRNGQIASSVSAGPQDGGSDWKIADGAQPRLGLDKTGFAFVRSIGNTRIFDMAQNMWVMMRKGYISKHL